MYKLDRLSENSNGQLHNMTGPAMKYHSKNGAMYGWYVHGKACHSYKEYQRLSGISDDQLTIIILKYGNSIACFYDDAPY